MDLVNVTRALKLFMRRERTRFDTLAHTATQALELGALILTAEHYRRLGCSIEPRNIQKGVFRAKLTARGNPWNFSWFDVAKETNAFEIHGNLPVKSATPLDQGTYVVDVGVAMPGRVARMKEAEKSKVVAGLENSEVFTFVEAKKLVIYPMLLAQFVGIVHEIKPAYLEPSSAGSGESLHPFPALVSIGPLRGTSIDIVKGFDRRSFRLNVVPTFDERIVAMVRDSSTPSPFRAGPLPSDDNDFKVVPSVTRRFIDLAELRARNGER